MNKTIVAVVGVVALACVAAFYVWTSHNRFYITTVSDGVAFEVDRKTGESWMLCGDRKIPQHKNADSHNKEQELPPAEASKITGNAGLSYGLFSGRLYNGTDWVVTRVVISVSAKEPNETVRWSRDFSESVTIYPLTTSLFSITVTGDDGILQAPWYIKQVFGYRQ